MPVVSGVEVVIAVGGIACAEVDFDVTTVRGTAGGVAGVVVSSGVVCAATDVGGRAVVVVLTPTSALSEEAQVVAVLVWPSAVVLTSLQPPSVRELVVVLVVASTSPQSEGELVVVSRHSEGMLVWLSSVMSTSSQSEGVVVVDVVVNGTAIVVEVVVVGCAPMELRHGSTGYSRRGRVPGVDAFRVFCCRQRRREGGRLGSRLRPRLSMSGTPTRQDCEPQLGVA